MGGYLSACYALQHPERVQHLILMVGRRGIQGQGRIGWMALLHGIASHGEWMPGGGGDGLSHQHSLPAMVESLFPRSFISPLQPLQVVPSGCGAQARRLAGASRAARPLDLAGHAVQVRCLLLLHCAQRRRHWSVY